MDSALFGLFADLPAGSVLLLGGEPGVGKSTLALQLAGSFRRYGPVVYMCAEERAEVVQERARRLLGDPLGIVFLEEFLVRRALRQAAGAALLVVDSLPLATVRASLIPGGPQAQREAGQECLRFARKTGACVLLVTQVSKKGLAGPRMMEHIVDVVLKLSYARNGLRVLEVAKNRLGPTPGPVLLRMSEAGLVPITSGERAESSARSLPR